MWILYADGAEFSVKYTQGDFVALRGTWGLWFFVCICQDVYISTNIRLLQLIVFVRSSSAGSGELTCPSGCGKRPQPCDLACHYTNLIPNSPSEFNFDTAEIQFVQEKWREEVITSVTRIC